MFGGNITTIEFRLHADPEANQSVEVVNAKAFMSQGKKEDNKKPMFFKLTAWKYAGKVLMGLQQKKLYMATGRFSMDYWGDDQEKSGLVFTAEDFGEKLFAPQQGNGQNNNQGQQNQNQGYQQDNGNQGGQQNYNQGQQQNQGYQQDPNQTGAYNGNSGGGFNGPPDDDIPFSCNIA